MHVVPVGPPDVADERPPFGRLHLRWPPGPWSTRPTAVIWVLAVLAAYALGYAVGYGHAPQAPATTARSSATEPIGDQVHWGNANCVAINAHVAIVAMQIANDSPLPATLTSFVVTTSPPGTAVIGTNWTDCGTEVIGSALQAVVQPGATVWASATVSTPGCAADVQVNFTVEYLLGGRPYRLPVAGPGPILNGPAPSPCPVE
jgi:hypothetical protein